MMKSTTLTIMGILAAGVVSSGLGATKTWQGADGDWNNAANWSPSGVPAAGDVVAFNATTTLSADFALPGWIGFRVKDGATVTVSGSISGTGPLVTGDKTDGLGTLKFTGANTFTGDLYHSNGVFHALSPKALGSDESGTVYTWESSAKGAIYFGGVDTARPVVTHNMKNLASGDYTTPGVFFISDTVNVFRGKWTRGSGSSYLRAAAQDRAKAYFRGGAAWNGMSLFMQRGAGAEVIVADTPVQIMYQYGHPNHAGTFVFAVAGNSIEDKSTSTQNIYGNVRTDVDWALTEASSVNQMGRTFDLNGTKQKFTRLFGRALSDTGVLTSATPAELELTGSAYTNTCKVTGPVSVKYAGSGLAVVSGASTATGVLTAGTGKTVELLAQATWAGTVDVESGATLLLDGAALAETSVLKVADGANVALGHAGTMTVAELWIGGTKKKGGFYDAADLPGFSGTGRIYVPMTDDPVTYTWTGAAGDGLVSTTGNWQDDADTAESTFLDTFVFPATGTDAAVSVNAARQLKTLSMGSGDGNWSLEGSGGLVFGADASWTIGGCTSAKARRITVTTPMTFQTGEVVWNFGTAGKSDAQVVFDNALSVDGSVDIVKNGGEVEFRGDAIALDGGFSTTGGIVRVCGATITSATEKPLRVRSLGVGTMKPATAMLVLSNAVVRKNVEIDGFDTCWGLQSLDRTTNRIEGMVTELGHNDRVTLGERCELRLTGGWKVLGGLFVPSCGTDSWIVFERTPITSMNFYADSSSAKIALAVPGNVINCQTFCATVRCDVDNVFVDTQSIQIGGGQAKRRGTLDLNGHSIRLRQLSTKGDGDNERGRVQSAVPGGVVHVVGANTVSSFDAAFLGHASLDLAGAGATMTLSNVSTTDGELKVSGAGAVLTLAEGASWTNAVSVTALDGTLALTGANQLGKDVDVYLADGRIDIPAGVSQRVNSLSFQENGAWVRQASGTWGALDNASVSASRRTARITGAGVLSVKASGTVIVFR